MPVELLSKCRNATISWQGRDIINLYGAPDGLQGDSSRALWCFTSAQSCEIHAWRHGAWAVRNWVRSWIKVHFDIIYSVFISMGLTFSIQLISKLT